MKTAAFIPIKSNSERVKGKNFLKLCGRKLYEHIVENSISAKCFDDIYVDTDSQEIKDYCDKVGVKTIEREEWLTKNDANGNDLLNNSYNKFPNYDLYFQLFATAPFLKTSTIQDCVDLLSNRNNYDSIFTVLEEYSWYWVNGRPVNYRPSVLPRSQDSTPVMKETTGLYGITNQALNKYRCRIGAKPFFYTVDPSEAVDLDNPRDFEFAETQCEKMDSKIDSPYIYDDE